VVTQLVTQVAPFGENPLSIGQPDMKRDEILRIYDSEYAASYDASFLLGDNFRECTEFEVSLIADLKCEARNWLDVACGTGYILGRFPRMDRAGLDISPAMLEIAYRANPGITFYEYDFRDERPEWANYWDFISCMWYAYCYADTVQEVKQVVKNLASWTSPEGICFLPVCDPNVLCKTQIPYQPPPDSDDGWLLIPAVIWTWIDIPLGRRHEGLVAPHLQLMSELLREYFRDVRLIQYPRFQGDCLESRQAFIATSKIP
jgi:SAM-dependent methyltransferase